MKVSTIPKIQGRAKLVDSKPHYDIGGVNKPEITNAHSTTAKFMLAIGEEALQEWTRDVPRTDSPSPLLSPSPSPPSSRSSLIHTAMNKALEESGFDGYVLHCGGPHTLKAEELKEIIAIGSGSKEKTVTTQGERGTISGTAVLMALLVRGDSVLRFKGLAEHVEFFDVASTLPQAHGGGDVRVYDLPKLMKAVIDNGVPLGKITLRLHMQLPALENGSEHKTIGFQDLCYHLDRLYAGKKGDKPGVPNGSPLRWTWKELVDFPFKAEQGHERSVKADTDHMGLLVQVATAAGKSLKIAALDPRSIVSHQ